MAKFYSEITEKLQTFIQEQKIFFNATAVATGRINLSPKGMDTFRILSPNQVGFLSVTGSGNETAAHLRVDDRMTIMFCSFDTSPLILRLYGQAKCIYPNQEGWDEYSKHFEILSGTRQIFIMDVDSVQTSCGYAVPFYEFSGERDTLIKWAEQKGDEGIQEYWQKNNLQSIDGLETGM